MPPPSCGSSPIGRRSCSNTARARPRTGGRHPKRVRPPGRRKRLSRPQTPAPRRGREDRHRSRRVGLLWISQTSPGRAQELTAARTHRLIRIRERQDVPIVADRACTGADSWAAPPAQRRTVTDRTDAEAGTRPGPRTCRTRRRPPEAPADSPPEPPQPEPHDGHRRHGPALERRRRKDSMDPAQRRHR